MFYEECIMDGKLWSRGTPDGKWTLVPYETILGRMLYAEKCHDALIEEKVAAAPQRYHR